MNVAVFEAEQPADYLSRLATSTLGRAYKAVALRELAIAEGQVVVDLGCGPVTDLSAYATATGPTGTVIGIDNDAAALATGAQALQHMPWVETRLGDVHSLDLPGGFADRVHSDRVLQHVADPRAVVAEARRVLRPGGRAVFAEPDYDTLVIDYPDVDVTRAYLSFVTERVIRNANIGRQLARLTKDVGFDSSRVIPVTSVFDDAAQADQVFGFERVTRRAVAAGYLSEVAAAEWLTHLRSAPFLASATLFITVADA